VSVPAGDVDMMTIETFEPLFGWPTLTADSARQLQILRLDMDAATRYNRLWHSQLPEPGAWSFGDVRLAYAAVFDNGVYGVGIWTRPVAGNRLSHETSHLLELRRLAIPDYAPKFTATRMLGGMVKGIRRDEPDVCRVLSYQMTSVHQGTIYKAANWYVSNKQETHQAWDTGSRRRPVDVDTSPKVRWEYKVRKCSLIDPKNWSG
jgi:hypothetical protein